MLLKDKQCLGYHLSRNAKTKYKSEDEQEALIQAWHEYEMLDESEKAEFLRKAGTKYGQGVGQCLNHEKM